MQGLLFSFIKIGGRVVRIFQYFITGLLRCFLVYPTVQVPAPTREELAAKRWTALDFPTNTVIASQTSLPAMSIPVGFTDNGLPVGLEVLGRPLSERALLRFARAWELAESPRRAAALTSVAEA